MSDVIHGALVAFICGVSTVYAIDTNDHSSNIWIVYGSAIAFAAGRAGVSAVRHTYNGNERSTSTTDNPPE